MSVIKSTIIVAGGVGARMQREIPKQFIELQGKPILMHTINAFHKYDAAMQLVLVLPADQIELWKTLCQKHDFKIQHIITVGGENRFESVMNGLKVINFSDFIAIHDGVRPLVSQNTIKNCFEQAQKLGNAIPVVDCFESIREIDMNQSKSVDRSKYRLVQTPQIFESNLLYAAYQQEYSPLFTDDASVVEAYFAKSPQNNGAKIELVDGNRENIKITTPFDLIVAEAILKNEH